MSSTSGIGERRLGFSRIEGTSPATSQVTQLGEARSFLFGRDGFNDAIASLTQALGLPVGRSSEVAAAVTELNNGKRPLPGTYVPLSDLREALGQSRHDAKRPPTKKSQDVSTARVGSKSGAIRKAAQRGRSNPTEVKLPPVDGPQKGSAAKSPREIVADFVLRQATLDPGRDIATSVVQNWPMKLEGMLVEAVASFANKTAFIEWFEPQLRAAGVPDPERSAEKLADALTNRVVQIVALDPAGAVIVSTLERVERELSVYRSSRAYALLADELLATPVSDALERLATLGLPDDDLREAVENKNRDTLASLLSTRVEERRKAFHKLMGECRPGISIATPGRFVIYEMAKRMPAHPMRLTDIGLRATMSVEEFEDQEPRNLAQAALQDHMASWSREAESLVQDLLGIVASVILGPVGIAGAVGLAVADGVGSLAMDQAKVDKQRVLAHAGLVPQKSVDAEQRLAFTKFAFGVVLGFANAASGVGEKIAEPAANWVPDSHFEPSQRLLSALDGLLELAAKKLGEAGLEATVDALQEEGSRANALHLAQSLLASYAAPMRAKFTALTAGRPSNEGAFELMVMAFVMSQDPEALERSIKRGGAVQDFGKFVHQAVRYSAR